MSERARVHKNYIHVVFVILYEKKRGDDMREPNCMGIYIHVPFCVRKCQYCDFLSFPVNGSGCTGEENRERYVQALCREIRSGRLPIQVPQNQSASNVSVASIFFGGGTPSLLTGEQIARILESVRATYTVAEDAEITMEANPGTISRDSLTEYHAAGVNRLSIGLQSAQNQELKLLGRIHTWEEFCENYRIAREVGFENINIDLMSALPGQSLETWEDTLSKVLALEPEHISAYSLIIEEGTPFYEKYGEMDCEMLPSERLPEEETERRMYEVTEEYLNRAGLYRYEISNYARPGYESRHNSFYWERVPYLGFGLGSSSFYSETRWRGTSDLEQYISIWRASAENGKIPIDAWEEVELLTSEDQMAEAMFLGLRMMKGVREQDLAERYGQTPEQVYGEILRRQEQMGLIERKDGYLRLTTYGVDVSNQVFCEYI